MTDNTRDVFGLVRNIAEIKRLHEEQNKKFDELVAAVRQKVTPQIVEQLLHRRIDRGVKGDGVIHKVWLYENCIWVKFAGSHVEYLVCIPGLYDEDYFKTLRGTHGNTSAYNAYRANRMLVLSESDLQLSMSWEKKDGTET